MSKQKKDPVAKSTRRKTIALSDAKAANSGGVSIGNDDYHPPYDRRSLESVSARLTRLLAEQRFDSLEQANAFLQQHTGHRRHEVPPPQRPLTPIEMAQDTMYLAWAEHKRSKRLKLAREALSISPDCADAYVLLAEETARTTKEALELYEEGVRAGERALGPEVMTEQAGHFWGMLETRPYMRARSGLAECLWELGEDAQAMEHYREMLRLNPNDNQGHRYQLAQLLLQEKQDESCKPCSNNTAGRYRRSGPTPAP